MQLLNVKLINFYKIKGTIGIKKIFLKYNSILLFITIFSGEKNCWTWNTDKFISLQFV